MPTLLLGVTVSTTLVYFALFRAVRTYFETAAGSFSDAALLA